MAHLLFCSKLSCIYFNLFNHKLRVNREFLIQPKPLQMETVRSANTINIEAPHSHIGRQPIRCNFYSSKVHFEVNDGRINDLELANYLIIHVHGGVSSSLCALKTNRHFSPVQGFFAQSPYLHECYLREWAVQMNVPILSINYSLVPEAPYPRAIEEIFYVYCWILKTSGMDAEKVLVVGDSAGAHLHTSLIIKCIEMGIPVPKGFLSIYGVFLSNYALIPSRMLCICDIILNYMTGIKVIKGYAGLFKKQEIEVDGEVPKSNIDSNDEIPTNHFLNPILASDDILRQFPPTVILSTTFDPFVDENIEMAKKLRALGVKVKFIVLPELIHGFLNGARIDKRCFEGSMTCVQLMKQLLEMDAKSNRQ